MKKQAIIEQKSGVCLDEAAHESAHALGEVIALGFDGARKNSLYTLGYMVGRYVYILDAADDLEDDLKSGSFNPFRAEYGNIEDEKIKKEFAERVRGMLNLTQSNALEALDSLEKNRFGDILENIVFDGLTFSGEKMLKKYLSNEETPKIYTVE